MRSRKLEQVTSSFPARMSFHATFRTIYLGSLSSTKELLYYERLSAWRLPIWRLAVLRLRGQRVPTEPISRPCALSKTSFSLRPGAHAHLTNAPTQFTSVTNAASLCYARTTLQSAGLVFRSSALIVSRKWEESPRSQGNEIDFDSAARPDVFERVFEK